MNGCAPAELAARAMDRLDPPSSAAVDRHVSQCATCRAELSDLREVMTALASVPPEAMIDGPPPDADLVLQGAIRRTHRESRAALRRRSREVLAAAAVVVALAAGSGTIIGQLTPQSAGETLPTAPSAEPTKPATPAAARTIAASDPDTGARMTVTLTPAAGWVRLSAHVGQIPAGERCSLVVVGRDGNRTVAGSWVVSPKGEGAGVRVSGSAAVALDDIAAIEVRNEQQHRYVTAAV